MATTASTTTFPTLNTTAVTTQPPTTVMTTHPPTTVATTQPPSTTVSTIPITTIGSNTTTGYTVHPVMPGGTTIYTQPTVIPNPSQYTYPPQYGGWSSQYGGYPYGTQYGSYGSYGSYATPQQPIQLTAPYGTAPIFMTPGMNLPPVS